MVNNHLLQPSFISRCDIRWNTLMTDEWDGYIKKWALTPRKRLFLISVPFIRHENILFQTCSVCNFEEVYQRYKARKLSSTLMQFGNVYELYGWVSNKNRTVYQLQQACERTRLGLPCCDSRFGCFMRNSSFLFLQSARVHVVLALRHLLVDRQR